MLRAAAPSRVALIAALSLALCHAGRAQTPSVSITVSPSGTVNSAYFAVQITTSNFSSVSDVSIVVIDAAGNNYPQQVTSGSNPNFSTNFVTSQLIPSGVTCYDSSVTVQAFVTGKGTTGEPPASASAQSNIITVPIQIGYKLGAASLQTAAVTAPTTTVHVGADEPFLISSTNQFDFYRYDLFGSYAPVVYVELDTTFPASTPYTDVASTPFNDQLPPQTGDYAHQYTANHSETYSMNGIKPGSFTFNNRTLSYYPVGTIIASNTLSATATDP